MLSCASKANLVFREGQRGYMVRFGLDSLDFNRKARILFSNLCFKCYFSKNKKQQQPYNLKISISECYYRLLASKYSTFFIQTLEWWVKKSLFPPQDQKSVPLDLQPITKHLLAIPDTLVLALISNPKQHTQRFCNKIKFTFTFYYLT